MKNALLITLLTCLCSTLVFAQSTETMESTETKTADATETKTVDATESIEFTDSSDENSILIRVNGIYVDEVSEGDEGWGATVEFAHILSEIDGFSQTIGIEIGYITSEADAFIVELETDLIPLLVNYTIGSSVEEGFIWEAGGGLGVYFVDADLNTVFDGSQSDDDIIFGGQIFGRLGYQLGESLGLMAGVRYMIADDAKLFGVEDEVINSVAFDLSLRFAF